MLVLVLLLLVISIFPKLNQPKILLFSCIILAFVEGIRWYSGTDFLLYLSTYDNVAHKGFPFFRRVDFLYYIFSGAFSKLRIPFTVFLLFSSGFYYFLFYKSLKIFQCCTQIALLFLFVTSIGLLGSNRQIYAMALGFLAVVLFINGSKWSFFLMAGAILFHVSAFILLPLFLVNRPISKKNILLVLVAILILIALPLEHIFTLIFSNSQLKYSYLYTHLQYYLVTFSTLKPAFWQLSLGILRRLLIILPFYLVKDLRSLKYFLFLRNTAVLSLALYLICVFHFTFLLGRLTIYYQMFDALSIALFANYFCKTRWKYHFLVGVSIFAVVIFFKSIAPYPQLFIPYHTIFGTF